MSIRTFEEIHDDPKKIILDKARLINLPKIPKFIKTKKDAKKLLLQICKYESFDYESRQKKLYKLYRFFYIYMSSIIYERVIDMNDQIENNGFTVEHIPSPFYFSGTRNEDKFNILIHDLILNKTKNKTKNQTVNNKNKMSEITIYFLNKYKVIDKYVKADRSRDSIQFGNQLMLGLFSSVRSKDIITLITDIVKQDYRRVACYLYDEMSPYSEFNKITTFLKETCSNRVISEKDIKLITKYYQDFLIFILNAKNFDDFIMYNEETIEAHKILYINLITELINPRGYNDSEYNNYKPFINVKMLTSFIQKFLDQNSLVLLNILNILHALLTENDIKGIFNYLATTSPNDVCNFINNELSE